MPDAEGLTHFRAKPFLARVRRTGSMLVNASWPAVICGAGIVDGQVNCCCSSPITTVMT